MNIIRQDFVKANVPVDDDAARPDPSPGLAAHLDNATAVMSVEPHLVEHGDIILGLRTPVTSILTDGTFWFYGDDSGTFIAKRPSWGRVQVIRGADQEAIAESLVEPRDSTDDAPAHGYVRPRAHLFSVPLP